MRLCVALMLALLVTPALGQVAPPPPPGTTPTPGGRGGAIQVPPRDNLPQAAGAGRLSGRVFSPNKQPVYRALIQLNTGNLQTARWTSTDAEGRWSFADVPGGSYTIAASRDGYVSMGFGQRGAYGTPTPIVLADNTVAANLDITLPRGGVITGRVTDDRGEGVGFVLVQAMRVRFVEGVRQLVEVRGGLSSLLAGGLTDDRGEYRLYGLAPGTYYLSATYGQNGQGRSDDRLRYATTFAPGTVSMAEATPITVSADKVSTSDFSLVPTRLVAVAGRVLNASGAPAPGLVRLDPVARGHAVEAASQLSSRSDSNGTFAIRGVPAGNYFLKASIGSAAGQELVSIPVSVSGEDLSGLVLQTAAVGSATGRLLIDAPGPNDTLDGFNIGTRAMDSAALSAREAATFGGPGNSGLSRTNKAGGFAISGLLGRHIVRLQDIAGKPGWWLKAVIVENADVTDSGFEFQPGRNVTIDVVVSRRMASVTGSVRDATGQPVNDYSAIAFTQDESKWTSFTRFILASGPRTDGTFKIEGLPAGDYIVVAVPPIEAGDETDPERLRAWRALGRQVSLSDAQAATVTLTLTR